MKTVKIGIACEKGSSVPVYSSPGSSGADIRADCPSPLVLKPMERALIPTGLHLEIPPGYEAQIRPRSGLALKHGITVLNTPGTIDADYRGELKIILINLGEIPFTVNKGDRIAQMIIAPVVQGEFEMKDNLDPSDRGDGGFGSTGL